MVVQQGPNNSFPSASRNGGGGGGADTHRGNLRKHPPPIRFKFAEKKLQTIKRQL